MKPRIPAFFVLLTLSSLLTSCVVPLPIIGGGVAGGGMDSSWKRREAEQYPRYADSSIRIDVVPFRNSGIKRERDALLGGFEERFTIRSRDFHSFGPLSIRFTDETISLKKDGVIVRKVTVPGVFYYSGLQVARFMHGGKSYYVMLTYSRASTSKVWLGVFDESGKKLFASVENRHAVYDVHASSGGVVFTGQNGTHIIHLN